jgi:predicted amidohydrolase YtcJ
MKEEEMITIMKSIWVLTVVLFLTTTALAQDQADLILTGGKIATLSYNEGFVDSLAVKDGFVYATGTDKEVQRFKGPETQVIDLHGLTVIPGLNDSHSHVIRGGRFYNLELRWDGVPSLKMALEMVRKQARRTPKGRETNADRSRAKQRGS